MTMQTVEQVAAEYVARGFSPAYVAQTYAHNAAAMQDRLVRIRIKGEGSKVAGYTAEMCERSIAMASDRALSVPAAMRAILEK